MNLIPIAIHPVGLQLKLQTDWVYCYRNKIHKTTSDQHRRNVVDLVQTPCARKTKVKILNILYPFHGTVNCLIIITVVFKYIQYSKLYGPAAEKRDLRTYANSENPDQPAHLRSLVRIFAVRLHNIGTLLKTLNQ